MKRDKNVVWCHVDPQRLDLTGMNVAIVGGTGGIGRVFSRFMAARGARVIVVGQTFRDPSVAGITFMNADLSLMHEAHRIGAALPAETLDLVLFTTGIFAAPTRQETAEGLERDMAVSYLSRLVILRAIGLRLGTARPAAPLKPRVFIMGLPGSGQAGTLEDLNAEHTYRPMTVHLNTVAGNEMLVLDAATRYPHMRVFGLNPGLLRTNIRSNLLGANTLRFRLIEGLIGFMTPSPESYAERLMPLLVSPDLEEHSGTMFDRKGHAILPMPQLTDRAYVQAFMAASEALVSKAGVPVAS